MPRCWFCKESVPGTDLKRSPHLEQVHETGPILICSNCRSPKEVTVDKNEKKLLAKAEIYDNGDDTYQIVASICIGKEIKIEIDKTVDTRTPEQRQKAERHLKTVE